MYSVTPDEMMVVCMARQIKDGDIVAQGIATPLVTTAYLLAKATHAPNLYFMSAIGQGLCHTPAPMGISRIENLWLDRALTNVGFVRAAADILPSMKPKEFFRPAQIDPFGNFNNVALGKEYITNRSARLRLPGTGGIPDVTVFINDIYLYVPRHSRLTFVEKLDVISGLGHSPNRKWGSGTICLVTELGQFDFFHGRMRLKTYHPHSSIQEIQRKTGFPLEVAPDVSPTPLPNENELSILRNEIDPFGVRKLELLSGAERRMALLSILAQEMKQ
jgi:acyl CoA:acetate/3-ketoacid CoA transferase beta subunit